MWNKVAVTGFHMLTPLGETMETWRACLDSTCAVKMNPLDKINRASINPEKYKNTEFEHRYRNLDPVTEMALHSTHLALEQSGIKLKEKNENIGVVVGSMNGPQKVKEDIILSHVIKKQRPLPSLGLQQTFNAMSGQVAMEFGLEGPNLTVSTACSSGEQAVNIATDLVKTGSAEVMVASGVEMIPSNNGMSQVYDGLHVLSKGEYSGPFSNNRMGFALGEGVGTVILENLAHAKKRNAKIYATISGRSLTCDAYSMAKPDRTGRGIARTLRLALDDAAIDPSKINLISAHATATVAGDVAEMKAINAVFKGEMPLISAIKGNIGHALGAAGAISLVTTILMMQEGVVLPTITDAPQNRLLDINVVQSPKEQRINYALVNAFGFGGNNASIILKKFNNVKAIK